MLNIEAINLFMNKKSQLENLYKTHGVNTYSLVKLKKKIGINCRLKNMFLK